MVLNLNGYNMNNGLMGLFQNGLSSFGGYSSFGVGGFSSSIFPMGSNYFANCYGQVDYDAMAGFGVANALMGVATQAVNSYLSQRPAKVDHQEEAKNVKGAISEKETKKVDLANDKQAAEEKVSTASAEVERLDREIKTTENNIDKLKAEYDAATKNNETNKASELNTQIREANEKLKKLQEEKTKQEKNVEENTEKVEKYTEQISKLDNEIAQLKIELKEHQDTINDNLLNKADGLRLTRTSDEEYSKKVIDGKLDDNTTYTKNDFQTAIRNFRKAVESSDKKEKAQTLVDMYKRLSVEEQSSTFKKATEIAYEYLQQA